MFPVFDKKIRKASQLAVIEQEATRHPAASLAAARTDEASVE
jgi:hypothetical protein